MRMKLFVGGLLLLATSSLALADAPYHRHHHYRAKTYKGGYKGEVMAPVQLPPAPCPHFAFGGGPYLGLSLGLRTNYSATPSNYKGLEGIISAGYGLIFGQRFYIAGEILLEGGTTLQINSNNNNPTGNSVNPKSTWNLGLSILPGFLLSDNVLGYLRLGALRTNFSNASPSNAVTGGQTGLGLQTTIAENWDLRGEYDYDFYPSISGSQLGSVKSDQFNLGLVYKF